MTWRRPSFVLLTPTSHSCQCSFGRVLFECGERMSGGWAARAGWFSRSEFLNDRPVSELKKAALSPKKMDVSVQARFMSRLMRRWLSLSMPRSARSFMLLLTLRSIWIVDCPPSLGVSHFWSSVMRRVYSFQRS